MASGKHLGFFWGDANFYLVEAVNDIPARVVPIACSSVGESDGVAVDDVRITALIQKALRDAHINSNQVKLSIASGTIIRSFLIPWMNPNEIGPAVAFEVKKYLPFSLKDLSYAYHSIPVTQEKVKKIRIIFVAVRRDLLERCTRILEQAGLSVVFSEPAPLSLVRALLAKKIIPPNQKTAVVRIESLAGTILFVHEGMVPFIREFYLSAPNTGAAGPQDPQLIKSRFLNEVHNSLEFYTRQYFQQPVTQMVVLSTPSDNPYNQWLNEDLGITVTSVDPVSIVGDQHVSDPVGVVNAFGAALAEEGKSRVVFNLSRKTQKKSALSIMGAGTFDIRGYMNAVKTAAICAVVLIGVFALTQMRLSELNKSVQDLKAQQKDFADMSGDDIQSKIDKSNAKLKAYKNIVLKSALTSVFVYIQALLPEGVWLKSFNVKSIETSSDSDNAVKKSDRPQVHWVVDIGGYVYTQDAKQEIRAVNELISRMKKEKHLTKFFSNVNLTTMQREDMNGYTVVSFSLTCT